MLAFLTHSCSSWKCTRPWSRRCSRPTRKVSVVWPGCLVSADARLLPATTCDCPLVSVCARVITPRNCLDLSLNYHLLLTQFDLAVLHVVCDCSAGLRSAGARPLRGQDRRTHVSTAPSCPCADHFQCIPAYSLRLAVNMPAYSLRLAVFVSWRASRWSAPHATCCSIALALFLIPCRFVVSFCAQQRQQPRAGPAKRVARTVQVPMQTKRLLLCLTRCSEAWILLSAACGAWFLGLVSGQPQAHSLPCARLTCPCFCGSRSIIAQRVPRAESVPPAGAGRETPARCRGSLFALLC